MRILYLFRSLAVWGGIERILVDKMNYLVEMYGLDVYLITTDQGNHPIPYTINSKVHIQDLGICFFRQYRYGLLERFFAKCKMTRQYEQLLESRLRDIRPDVMVCTTADMISSIVKVKGTIPLIVESHSICTRTINHGRNGLLRIINKSFFLNALKQADVVVALTERDANEWRRYHHYVEVIPNAVHLNQGTLSSVTSKRVMFVGRFDYQKRAQEAIRIWSIVHAYNPDWMLDIYGEGEMKDAIEAAANKIEGVAVHTPTSMIFDRYRECSILISTSLFEPFGLVITEAMSCGLPVIAYDCPYGPADIITNGVDGFLIRQDDREDFVLKLSCLMSNQNMRAKMGKSGRKAADRYAPSLIMPSWYNLFLRLNDKKRKKAYG